MRDEWVRPIIFVLSTAWRADWRGFLGVLATLSLVFTAPLNAFWFKSATDGLIGDDRSAVALGLAGIGAHLVLFLLVSIVVTPRVRRFSDIVGFTFDKKIAELCSRAPGLVHNEHPEYQDKLELLRDRQGQFGQSLISILHVVAMLIRLTVTAVLLVTVQPFLLLLAGFAWPAMRAARRAQNWHKEAEDASAPHQRRGRHLYELSLSPNVGMEARVFGIEDALLKRQAKEWLDADRPMSAKEWKAAGLQFAVQVAYAVGFLAAVLYTLLRASEGRATPGEVVMVIMLARRVNTDTQATVGGVSGLQWALRGVQRYLWLSDHTGSQLDLMSRGPNRPPHRLVSGIVLENVSFRYPNSEEWALRDASAEFPTGAAVALVGENGAGKSTLVKLIARFYDPIEGRILVDGVDLREIDLDAWRERLSGAFQDYCRFEFAARESVGVGELARIADEGCIRGALTAAGASGVVSDLQSGLDTQLGGSWPEGAELSGGQWQKLALARSFMREDPLVLLLDEPTASLDARTEHELFSRLTRAAHDGSRAGAVTLLVSHRFSTVPAADQIVVIEGGRVVAQGSHADLMNEEGTYAELYRIQERAYRASDAESEGADAP